MRARGSARTGALTLGRGSIRTPAFMPVGTAGTVKAMTDGPGEGYRPNHPWIGYHLTLGPGAERVAGSAACTSFARLGGTDPDRFQAAFKSCRWPGCASSTRTA